ncbi:hypothetical protein [Propionimicrobium lymphophilum]|uniref:hypothetical protein n=1 Tax=Propionimicrobium lymphophilum TaxID=33012 RepID=UPI00288A5493|nr:hypothetical protein [Propionimicrobium lymphophilum]
MSFKYKKLNLRAADENLAATGKRKRLTVTCMLGHRLALLEQSESGSLSHRTFYSDLDPIKEKAKKDDKARQEAEANRIKASEELARAEAKLKEIDSWQYVDALGREHRAERMHEVFKLEEKVEKLIEEESRAIETYSQAQAKFNYSGLTIITPDTKALAWACMGCFNDDRTGANRRTRPRKHTGRLSLWHLVAILANMEPGQTETVKGNEASAKRLGANYHVTSKEGQRKTQKLLDTFRCPKTSAQDYAKWEKYNYVFSGLSHAQKQQRYSDR